MWGGSSGLIIVLCMSAGVADGTSSTHPEQVHISYGRDPTQMIVTWSTKNDTKDSLVKYGLSPSTVNKQATGQSHIFVDGGSEHRYQYIHNVVIQGLVPGQKYFYNCGSDKGWSDSFSFTAMKTGFNWSPRFVVYGDLGKDTEGTSIPRIAGEKQMYDAVLHVGDFAYDLNDNQSATGDTFLKNIEPIAAYLPYMTCPGNHEVKYNFSNYKNRFSMPFDEQSDNMFYSFDIGPAHIISFSTEYYFTSNQDSQLEKQYNWLKKDLAKANQNRDKHPWIITMGHRPMYCSNEDAVKCSKAKMREGVTYGLENVFRDYHVDIAIWAHVHHYERYWPVFNSTVYNGSYDHPYTNPKAVVHVLTSSAGCKQDHYVMDPPKPWSAFKNNDYGYTRMTIHNSSQINFQQVSIDKDGDIIDDFTVIKDSHV